MVDSVPRWQLSLSGPIQSDHLIADCDDTAFGEGTLTWQDPVHSWKAGPGEVMTVENKQTKKFYPSVHLDHVRRASMLVVGFRSAKQQIFFF